MADLHDHEKVVKAKKVCDISCALLHCYLFPLSWLVLDCHFLGLISCLPPGSVNDLDLHEYSGKVTTSAYLG
jgi:hypothetical protein